MKLIPFFLPALILLSIVPFALAKTSINISNNADSSTNRVTIKNNVSTTNDDTDSETRVRIEQNGEVKTFEATGDEDISYKSEDGNTKVNINNNSSSVKVQQRGSASVISENGEEESKQETQTKENEEQLDTNTSEETKNSETGEEATTVIQKFLDNLLIRLLSLFS